MDRRGGVTTRRLGVVNPEGQHVPEAGVESCPPVHFLPLGHARTDFEVTAYRF